MDVKHLVEIYSFLDEPVPLKNLFIYPILVKDYPHFISCYDVCTIDKNTVPDIEIISMSYLDYLLSIVIQDEKIMENGASVGQYRASQLIELLQLCFHVESKEIEIKYEPKNKHFYLIVQNEVLNGTDFDNFIKIISFQNIYDYSDGYVNPDVKKAVKDYYDLKNKDIVIPDLEERVSCVTVLTGLTKSCLLNMTYREFERIFHTAIEKLDYQIYKQAEMSGMVKFDKPIEHWVYKKKKDKYADAFMSAEKFKNKIKQANG